MSASWWDLLFAAISGGGVVKLIDYLYMEYRRQSEAKETSKQIVNRHLDPVLKAADELVGKMRSLAQDDFVEFKNSLILDNLELLNFCYLFAQFWARVQILRIESIYVNLSDNSTGKNLKAFLDALESKSVQIIDRPNQRAIGELLIKETSQSLSTLTFYEFVNCYKSDPDMKEWLNPLIDLLKSVDTPKFKKSLLTYGVILHALIDTLDPKHSVTKNREGWANKLTKQSCRDLKFRVFRIYLPCVSNVDKYVSK